MADAGAVESTLFDRLAADPLAAHLGITLDEVRPGYASQAKILVINHGTKEAIPVAIDASSELLRVQVAGTAAVQIAGTPNVQARHARQMWEYRQLVLPAGQDPTASLNAAGLDGWEATGIALATADATRVILKRPTDR